MFSTLTVLLLLLTPTKGFEESLISGSYTLSQGDCTSPLTLSLNSSTLPSNTIFLNNTVCTGPSLSLTQAKISSLHTFLHETPQIGSFLTSPQNLTCGNHSISSITLFSSKKHVTLPTILSPTNQSVSIENDLIYLFTSSCIYTREAPDDDGIIQQLLNTVTECLPGDALINTPTGLTSIKNLHTNSLVYTSAGIQPILTWTHRDPNHLTAFLRLRLATHSVDVTPGHYVFADGSLIQARFVAPGMGLHTAAGVLPVTKVEQVVKKGVYNPHTPAGDLLVGEGKIRISCYSSAVEPLTAHALFAPVRGAQHFGLKWIYDVGKAVEALADRLRNTPVVSLLSA